MNVSNNPTTPDVNAILLATRELQRGVLQRFSAAAGYGDHHLGDKAVGEKLRQEAEALVAVAHFLGTAWAAVQAAPVANQPRNSEPPHGSNGAKVVLYWNIPGRPATIVVFGKHLYNPHWSPAEWIEASVKRAHHGDASLPATADAVSHFRVIFL